LQSPRGWTDYQSYKNRCDVLQSIAHRTLCGISDFEDCQAGGDYGGFYLSTANLPDALTAALPLGVGSRPAALDKLNASQSRELKKFIRTDGDEERTCVAVAKTSSQAYAIVEETDGQAGGQILLRLPAKGAAVVLMADTTVLPLGLRAVPADARQQLLAQTGNVAQALAKARTLDAYALGDAMLQILAGHGVAAPLEDGMVAASDVNDRVYSFVQSNVGRLSSRNVPGTNNGRLGCAWAVNEVVRQALGHPIGGGLSTADMHDALVRGRGREVQRGAASHGTVIISPTEGDNIGHVGILGDNSLIYSNRSSDGIFSQNYDVNSWYARYQVAKRLEVLFYDLNA
jgi:hypothetical protein